MDVPTMEGNYRDSVAIRDIKKTTKEITAILRGQQQNDIAYQHVIEGENGFEGMPWASSLPTIPAG